LASALALCIGNVLSVSADSRTITFEDPPYHTGSIDHQDGWAGTGGGPILVTIDQAVVTNNYGYSSFGAQSWRMSNAYTDGAFGDWPFAPSLNDAAGETNAQNLTFSAPPTKNHFEVQWSFASTVPNAEQAGLQVSTSPDRGDGARMSFIRMKDLPDGLAVEFSDYLDHQPYGSMTNPAAGCGTEDEFRITTVATHLDRDEPHRVKLTMDLVDGPRNDVVKVYVDGNLRFTGTSWEDYFRWCEATGQSRTIDSMLFQARTTGGQASGTLGKGFLFDNLSYSTSNAEQCDNHNSEGEGDVDNGSGGHGHMKFNKHGCGRSSGDNVQHTDSQEGHNFQSTSVDAAAFSTAANSRTVSITGTGTDNGLPVAFTMVAVDLDGAAPATYSLVLSNGYSFVGTVTNGTLSVL
jgi:hypothetical protein